MTNQHRSSTVRINSSSSLLNLDTPIVMGILNITPDSFYSRSRVNSQDEILKQTNKIVAEGATIIDVGGYSTRPGAADITIEEEIRRLDDALAVIRKHHPDAILSVDTFRSEVAQFAVNQYNVSFINDISGGTMDGSMFETIASLNVGYILMHIQGTPQNMQMNPQYTDVTAEVILSLSHKVDQLTYLGVKDIMIDPGFGFGKTIDHNYELLSNLHQFKLFNKPIMAGLSRKSLIYKTLGCTADDALNGTTTLNTIALLKGAKILRVHDVKEAVDCIKLVHQMQTKE